MNRRLLLAAKWVVSIGLLVVIVTSVDLRATVIAGKQANLSFFALGTFIMLFGLFIRSYKWRLLLIVQGVRVSLWTLFRVTWMSLFFNNFFLGTIGGDVFRMYKAAGYAETTGAAASSVIMERATGFFAMFRLLLPGYTLHSTWYRKGRSGQSRIPLRRRRCNTIPRDG